ncbi:ATP-binding protein [Promicromonospora thailandica]|uniref:histidine kinase n=1 Tax=Promicromonospora thailandica TaxID=765201 RepID=A0A9X2G7N5_9MICO|nr:HAMP domain-containing sensor histidine kinase [Promicromonospora thailandica]MCP2264729.1 two-component system, OmpR family, sensor histidine kinase MtrB [Promicromonospora thailandica]BFF19031.1 HAMP domain-containing sensor histidine kinase [Promicromonospora thailandica]
MVLAFVAVAMVTATAASAAGYAAARASLVEETQRRAVETVRDQVTRLAPETAYPPDQQALDRLRTSLGPDAMVTFEGLTSASGSTLGLITDDLRARVARDDGFAVQRVADDAGPRLVLGTPVLLTDVDGSRRDSGVDVYVVHDLAGTEAQLDRWTRVVVLTIAGALPLAVALALVVSRSVLRPVQRLAHSATELAEGNLGVRLTPSGRDELADLVATFNDTAAALERSVGELRRREAEARRFVADVSHELRTPIMALTSIIEVLRADAAGRSDQDLELATMAVDRTRRLARLAEDLLELSRLDAGVGDLRPEHVDVVHVVTGTVRTRGWADVAVAAAGPVPARVDVRRVDLVVANLVGNALRHGAPPVVVEVRAEPDHVVVGVTDHGPGLPAGTDPELLFGRFAKGDPSRTSSDGSGLGLAIARVNARLHGGDVTAHDDPGGGARFELRLPRRPEVSADREDDREDDDAPA